MKGYKKIWSASFFVSIVSLVISIFVFLTYMNSDKPAEEKISEPKTQEIAVEQEYIEPQDNVGYISFTEDQMTEIARNIFSLDDFLADISVEFSDGEITVGARIKDVDNLIKTYPFLKKYKAVLKGIKDKKLKIIVGMQDKDGKAALEVESVSVSGIKIDGDIISPFIESDDFARLFDVDFNSIELSDGEVVFKNGVPDILAD